MMLSEITEFLNQADQEVSVPRRTAIRVTTTDVHGESNPRQVECDDGALYLVKNLPDTGQRRRLADDIGFTRLARSLYAELSPEMVVVDFPQDFIDGNPELLAAWGTDGCIAPGVGSAWIEGALDACDRPIAEAWDPTSLARVIGFQTWCGGRDARAIVRDGGLRVWTIDHAHFGGPETIQQNDGLGKDLVFIPLGMNRGAAFERASDCLPAVLDAIEAFTPSQVARAFAGTDPSWEVPPERRADIVQYLVRRRPRTRRIVEPMLPNPKALYGSPAPDDVA